MGEGYDPDRFVDRVFHSFKCCICQCVLNEPRLCEAEEHQFCLNCISQHLPNSQTCPECRQTLTLETLKCPAKNFKNVLSELKIKCDYINRGCLEHVELGNLQNHVNNCEYRPVTCENCHLEVNAKHENNHKKSFCQLGGANIQVIQNVQICQKEMINKFSENQAKQIEVERELKETLNMFGQKLDEVGEDLHRRHNDQIFQLNEVDGHLENVRTQQNTMESNVIDRFNEIQTENSGIKRKNDDMQKALDEIKQTQSGINEKVEKMEDEARGEVTELKRRHDNIYDKVKKVKTNVNKLTPSQVEQNIQHLEMGKKQDQIEVRHDETKKALHDMKQTQSEINEKVEKIEGSFKVLKQQLERLEGLLGHLFQGNIVNRDGAQATDPTIPTNNQDVIILGGWYDHGEAPPLNTVEKYNIIEKRSTMLPPLNHPRAASASCVYNNDVLVVGGYNGKELTFTIEVLKMNQHPLRWAMFDGKLPVRLTGHVAIVYQGKLYIIGGYNWNESRISNAIYEIALTPPYTAKLLTKMPEPRTFHRAELVNGKLFILGGSTTVNREDFLDSVVVYDFIKNEFKPCPSLPQPVSRMSTVTSGDKIIVFGGFAKNSQPLNDVIMYDTETGQIEQLPSMIHKRNGSSAVIMNDVIVVFGGRDNKHRHLNSVETFTINGDGWKELPGMIEKRCYATAVVKPHM